MDTGKLQERIHGIMVNYKKEEDMDMVYWQVTRKKTWYTGKLQEIRRHGIQGKLQERRHGILVSRHGYKLQERRHGILVSYW